MKRVAILGAGSFGRFLKEKLDEHFNVTTFDRQKLNSEHVAELGRQNFIILAIPLQAYAEVLAKVKPHLNKDTIIIDTCSVKVKPLEVLSEMAQTVVLTHPLFGPESARDGLIGHSVVVCPINTEKSKAETQIIDFCEKLGLKTLIMSAEDHDRLMAKLQGLTFFVARVLDMYGVTELPVMTPSYTELLDLASLDEKHSQALFDTVQGGNPYTKSVREDFIKIATQLNKTIEN